MFLRWQCLLRFLQIRFKEVPCPLSFILHNLLAAATKSVFEKMLQFLNPINYLLYQPVVPSDWGGRACVLSHFSHVQLCATLWTVDPARLRRPWGFSRQEHQSGLLCPPPGDLPDPGIKPVSLRSTCMALGFFTTSTSQEARGGQQGTEK